jgi:Na+-driven multidrug efflux pump
VGHALGRGEPEAARAIVRSQGAIGAAIGLTVACVVVSAPSLIAAVFSLEGAPGELLRSGLYFFAPFFFVEVLAYSIEIIFTHNGYGRYVLMSEFSMNMIAIIGASFVVVLVFGGGIYGAWGAFAAYQVGHALILGAGLRRGAWLTEPVERPLGVAP